MNINVFQHWKYFCYFYHNGCTSLFKINLNLDELQLCVSVLIVIWWLIWAIYDSLKIFSFGYIYSLGFWFSPHPWYGNRLMWEYNLPLYWTRSFHFRLFEGIYCFCRELLSYTDGTIPLAETDIDVIAKSVKSKDIEEDSANGGKELPADSSAISVGGDMLPGKVCEENINDEAGMQSGKSQSGGNPEESQRALKLSFTLPASCYATMAVRELLKTSTSVC